MLTVAFKLQRGVFSLRALIAGYTSGRYTTYNMHERHGLSRYFSYGRTIYLCSDIDHSSAREKPHSIRSPSPYDVQTHVHTRANAFFRWRHCSWALFALESKDSWPKGSFDLLLWVHNLVINQNAKNSSIDRNWTSKLLEDVVGSSFSWNLRISREFYKNSAISRSQRHSVVQEIIYEILVSYSHILFLAFSCTECTARTPLDREEDQRAKYTAASYMRKHYIFIFFLAPPRALDGN